MERTEIINGLIEKYNYKSYLEIGIREKEDNFNHIKVLEKYGVDIDPDTGADFIMESDEFFKQNNNKFDIIFIDGLHVENQVYRDINNSLACLNDSGCIVVHDCNPAKEIMQRYPRPANRSDWNGTVWKAWLKLRKLRDDLEMFVVDTDFGCGVIRVGNSKKIKVNVDANWHNLNKNRKRWLNLISINDFNHYLANKYSE